MFCLDTQVKVFQVAIHWWKLDVPEVNLNILQWEERIQIAIWPWVATQYSCPQKENRIFVGVFTYPIFGIFAIDPCPCRLNLVDSILCDVLVKSVKCAVLI